ncbi:MAG TPA: glycosyltransferase [Bacteroidales bacterium]|nr:glycosyltransferase [Bacteroidales bacterium]
MHVSILGTAHPYRGGLASFNERLARQFLSEGYDTEILTFTLQYPGFLFPGKTQFTDAEAPDDMKIKRVLNSLNPINWIKVGSKIRKQKPGILLIKYWHPFMAPCFGTVARIAAGNDVTRVICIFDNVIPHEKSLIDRLFTQYFLKSVNGAIVMSGSVLEDLKSFRINFPVDFNPHPLYDNYGTPLNREDALRNLKLPAENSYMLFFGFIRAYKGLDLLLEAFANRNLRNGKLKLIVAGEFYENDKPYRDIIKKYDMSGDVILIDHFIGENEVSSFFSAADLIVQPYRSATQSGVTQIAYHFGKPMLVTNVGGLGEIVKDGQCGYVVNPDPQSVSAAISDFFTNNRYDEFSAGVNLEKSRFTWDKLTAAVINISRESTKQKT